MSATPADARIWNLMAKRYSRKPVPDAAAYETRLEKTNERLRATEQVLEIGCGTGTTALHHADRVQRIVALDFSERMIDIARDKARAAGVTNVEFAVRGIDALATTERYDVVLAHSILHLMQDVPRTLRTVHGLLESEGRFISTTPCLGDIASWLRHVAPLGRRLGILPRLTVFDEATFIKWIRDAGFEIEEIWHPAPKASHYVVARKRDGAGPARVST